MSKRLMLHELLCETLGSRNVYFQPPGNIKMQYPAIVYSRNDIPMYHADNNPYIISTEYQIILIDKNPDSEIIGKLSALPRCRFDRHYKADNLNHDSFIITY